MENQMEQEIQHDMDTTVLQGFNGVHVGILIGA